ncbi:hypothetical protein SPRG_08692 [Saprolegnia parasitica CBS 223.65]|uniref:Peptidase S33 tripeptidyl aminopeptidase-like C-terminal domain-containing protein n=1 Tax=Saprolegnia parasitica (strain CBS 223.65) TaxID=695850 RepID=A0A067C5J0_SAPPC|nr:hypothetical protein SPRG_08692 [Saprolegnia parasitica CBS 223.65]KDO26039.1 hypothetical protein SPRG_08692 [Saprolegnia parasitica CBS 223.65]|eukprot:XP_012203325.1 hypothetical protein SPRG_08692 [Saprolegnia parasitica CBS 223.65]
MRYAALSLLAASAAAALQRTTGWLHCPLRYSASVFAKDWRNATCATFDAPLCYPGTCASTTTNISVFVKRLEAVNGASPKAIWLLQGGPGASSINMEGYMQNLYVALNKSVSVYTMDHRGTGKSTYLDCATTEATTNGSPWGTSISPSELPECLRNVRQIYGNDAAAGFSSHSAASDVAALIQTLTPTAETYVYGVSYGTHWVRRLMALDPPTVHGYILDGVSGLFSRWNLDYLSEVDTYFDYCTKDATCRAKLGHDPAKVLRDLYHTLDTNATARSAACVRALPNYLNAAVPPSWALRHRLKLLLAAGVGFQELIPILIYRLHRCSRSDEAFLAAWNQRLALSNFLTKNDDGANDQDRDSSALLYGAVAYSEMWEQPVPSRAELESRFLNNLFGFNLTTQYHDYCVFTGATTDICNGIDQPPDVTFTYPSKLLTSPTLPSQSSVLIFAGALDTQTPLSIAVNVTRDFHSNDRARLVTYPYAGHSCLLRTSVQSPGQPTCATTVLASYVAHGGNIAQLNTSCLDDLVPTAFTLSAAKALDTFGVRDAYEGNVTTLVVASSMTMTTQEASLDQTSALVIASGCICVGLVSIAVALLLRRRSRATSAVLVRQEPSNVCHFCR